MYLLWTPLSEGSSWQMAFASLSQDDVSHDTLAFELRGWK